MSTTPNKHLPHLRTTLATTFENFPERKAGRLVKPKLHEEIQSVINHKENHVTAPGLIPIFKQETNHPLQSYSVVGAISPKYTLVENIEIE